MRRGSRGLVLLLAIIAGAGVFGLGYQFGKRSIREPFLIPSLTVTQMDIPWMEVTPTGPNNQITPADVEKSCRGFIRGRWAKLTSPEEERAAQACVRRGWAVVVKGTI